MHNIKKITFIVFLLTISFGNKNINKAMNLYMEGELSLITGDILSAQEYFQEALKYSPNNPEILLSLIEIEIGNKDFIQIEEYLYQYLELDTLDFQYGLMIIDLYKLFNKSNTLDILNILIDNNDSIELKFSKAEILILNEDWEELLLLYSDMYISEQNEEVLNMLLSMGLMIENPTILYESLKHIWNNNKSNTYILELLIQLSYLSNNDIEIKTYLDELIENDPNNSFGIMMLAEIHIFNKNFFEAVELLDRIEIGDETPIELYKMLLICYSNLGDYDNEIRLSQDVIQKFPFDPIGYESLALSYLDTAKYIKAIEVLNNAVNIFPEEYYFFYYLGLCYRNSSKNQEAINYFLKALKINPELKNVMHELAKLYNLESRYEISDSLFTILLEKDVNDTMIMNDYAYLIADRENVGDQKLNFALKLSKNVINIVPDSPEYLDTIGWIYYKLGKYKIALDYLLKSQSLDKQNSVILEHVGDVYLKLEKYEKALKMYNKIMINNPNNIKVIEKINSLNEKQ